MAGKFSFAVTAAAGRVGRAYVKPLYAQAASPLAYHRLSVWLTFASVWWAEYLNLRPATKVCADLAKRHAVCWTDAAGVSRWLAAVLFIDGRFHFVRCITPDCVWVQLLDRGDNQIGAQEMLAVLLFFESFSILLGGAQVTLYVDNQGVLGSCVKGSSDGPEINLCVGRLWLHIAFLCCEVVFVRVESKANVADGPTRDDLTLLQDLSASESQAKLPGWLRDLWSPLQANDLAISSLLP